MIKKISIVSIIIVMVYLSLFYQEVNHQPHKLLMDINYEELLAKEWIVQGEIAIDDSFSLDIQGKLKRIDDTNDFEITCHPIINNRVNETVNIQLTGEINHNKLVIHKSLTNEQEVVILIDDLIDMFGLKTMNKEFLNTQVFSFQDIKFEWKKFLEISQSNRISELAVQYCAEESYSYGNTQILLTIMKGECHAIDVKLQDKDKLKYNISLHQSHF